MASATSNLWALEHLEGKEGKTGPEGKRRKTLFSRNTSSRFYRTRSGLKNMNHLRLS